MLSNMKNKYDCLPVTVRATIWFTLCNIILKGINFISSFIFTRVLPQSEYGLLSIYSSFEQIFLILATWEIQLGAYTRGLYKFKGHTKEFTISMQLLTNILTVAFFALVFLFIRPVSQFTKLTQVLFVILFLELLFKPAYSAWLVRKRVVYDYMPAVFLTLFYSVACVVVPYICVLLIGNTAIVKFASTLITSAIFCFILWLRNCNYFELRRNPSDVKKYIRFMISYEGPLVIHSLSYLILCQSDRIMIGRYVGNEQAALYSVAYNIAIVITLLQSSLDQVLSPWRYSKLDEKNYSNIGRISNLILFIYGVILLGFILVAPDLLRLFYPTEYFEGIWCIPPVATSAFFMLLYSFFVGIETYYEKTKYVLCVSFVCGLLNIVLNYFGIHLFGYIACAYTTLISYVLFAIGHFAFMKKTLREFNVAEKIYNLRVILLISIIILSSSLLFTMFYDLPFARYAVLIVLMVILFAFRTRVVESLSLIRKK